MSSPSRTPLTEAEIKHALVHLPEWVFTGDRLLKTFQFKTFRDAMAFIVRLGFEAEQLDHHPELGNVYNKVSLALNTHDAGGKVTGMDVELAKRIEKARAALA
jgi:4a-hydroxytetrahydrobiopterin dehydratase